MKLYFSPGACSLAPHIMLNECGFKYDMVKVDLKTKKTENGDDFFKINPKGYVPCLQADNGEILTEAAIIMQYLADQKAGSTFLASAGTWPRYHTLEMLNFISSEIHKGFGPLFYKDPEEVQKHAREKIGSRFDLLNEKLKNQNFLMGSDFTLPDAYLFVMMRWARAMKFEMTKWPKLMGLFERIEGRAAVQTTLKKEGLT